MELYRLCCQLLSRHGPIFGRGIPNTVCNLGTYANPAISSWLGRIYRVAIYTRALSAPEIVHHYQLGFSTDTTDRLVKDGLVALYIFAEGEGDTVHDVSNVGAPLDLDVAPRSHVRWLNVSNGCEIMQPAIIQSRGPATKLADAFRGGDELTVETWIAPGNLTQERSGRIVAFASGRTVFVLRGREMEFHVGSARRRGEILASDAAVGKRRRPGNPESAGKGSLVNRRILLRHTPEG